MKLKYTTLIGLVAASIFSLASCDKHSHGSGEGEDKHEDGDGHADEDGDDHKHEDGDGHADEDGEDHKHEDGDGHADEDGDDHKHEDGDGHADEDGDDHAHEKVAGPNGGRVLHEYEPHVEFLVLDDRKVRITFLDDDLKPAAAAEQTAYVIAGDRSAPTELSFAKEGGVLVSDKSLPATNDFPVVVQISSKPGEAPVNAKFQANMLDCPTCDFLEYACICDHAHEHGEGSDHKHD